MRRQALPSLTIADMFGQCFCMHVDVHFQLAHLLCLHSTTPCTSVTKIFSQLLQHLCRLMCTSLCPSCSRRTPAWKQPTPSCRCDLEGQASSIAVRACSRALSTNGAALWAECATEQHIMLCKGHQACCTQNPCTFWCCIHLAS